MSEEQKEQEIYIDEMFTNYADPEAPMDPAGEDIAEETQVVDDVEVPELPVEEPATVDKIEEPTQEPIAEPIQLPELSELEDLQQKYEALKKQLEQVAPIALQAMNRQPEQPVQETEPPINFLAGMDLDDIISDPETLNNLLHRVAQQAAQQGALTALRSMPAVAQKQYAYQSQMQERVNKFYQDYPDLGDFKGIVGMVTNQIISAQPEMYNDWDSLSKQVAETTRQNLGFANQVTQQVQKVPNSSKNFAAGTSQVKAPPKQVLSGQAAEVDQFMRDIGLQ